MFTHQELIYLALGQRKLAQESLEQAEKQVAAAVKDVYREAAETYRELAAKCERLQQTLADPKLAAPGARSPSSVSPPSPLPGTRGTGPGTRGARGTR